MMPKAKPEPAVSYQPTAREQIAVDRFAERKAKRAPMVPVRVVECVGGKATLQVDHKDAGSVEPLFSDQFGTDSSEFASFITEQLGFLSVVAGTVNANVLNAHLSIVRGVAPQDEVETLLACQMAAVHVLTMTTAADAYGAGKRPERKDVLLSQINKLSRTFTSQVEALKRYRAKGDQKVTVEHRHYHLAPGAQAVFGDVETKGKEQPDVRIPERPAVLGNLEADRQPVPRSSSDGVVGVPISRRERRSAIRAVQ